MKNIEILCDISDCKKVILPVAEIYRLPVIFTTHPRDGRIVEPFISGQNLDMCDECHSKMVKSGKFVRATGSQGNNVYALGE